ncbi:MAG: hypothetical protein Q9167_000016 [Letrouitia subvulpina]
MSAGTRREKRSDGSSPRESSQAQKSSEIAETSTIADNANAFANVNRENSHSSSYIEAARTISAKDFTEFPKRPCHLSSALVTGRQVPSLSAPL